MWAGTKGASGTATSCAQTSSPTRSLYAPVVSWSQRLDPPFPQPTHSFPKNCIHTHRVLGSRPLVFQLRGTMKKGGKAPGSSSQKGGIGEWLLLVPCPGPLPWAVYLFSSCREHCSFLWTIVLSQVALTSEVADGHRSSKAQAPLPQEETTFTV